jgi:small subunit ribosomal protein S16
MAVKLRLRKIGSNKNPFYRIIAADARSANGGSFLEELGWYDPVRSAKGEVSFKLDLAKADAWIAKGAQPSETVVSLMKKARKAQA